MPTPLSPHSRFASSPSRLLVVVIAATLVASALLAIGALVTSQPNPPAASPSPMATPTPTQPSTADPYRRPADWSAYRPAVHVTPAANWMNDPQKPFLLDGVWHFYYLYNADHPDGNGTAWYHATSTDLVHWQEHGIAIEKYTNGLGDIWTGTAVVDHNGTAGFGENAVIALVTQQAEGVQRQSLFYSTDGGYSFESYEGNPVMDNPGVADWRDPRVFWDDTAEHWVMALAEHDRIGFYTSPNLREWSYASDFATDGLGVLECPDLFPMAVDGDPDDVRWVLLAGANGAAEGMTTGTVYWTGDWDGESFTPDGSAHRWLDRGADYYAAVTWDDSRLTPDDRLTSRYSMGWMNNWAYAGDFPTADWQGGSDSIIRSIRLTPDGEELSLRSAPAEELRMLEGEPLVVDDIFVADGTMTQLPNPTSDAFRLTLDVASASGTGEVRVKVHTGDGRFATVGYDFDNGVAFVARDADAIAADMPEAYRAIRTAPVTTQNGRVRLDIIVDAASIEVFAGQGEAALTMATFGAQGEWTLTIEAERGTVSVSSATLTPLRVAEIERAAVE